MQAESEDPDALSSWGLTFEVSVPDWLGGGTHELVVGGVWSLPLIAAMNAPHDVLACLE